jgi:hypothetical protein
MFVGVCGRFGARGNVQLVEQVAQMSVYGFDAEAQIRGYRLVGFAGRY